MKDKLELSASTVAFCSTAEERNVLSESSSFSFCFQAHPFVLLESRKHNKNLKFLLIPMF